jgi:hypothetical protein
LLLQVPKVEQRGQQELQSRDAAQRALRLQAPQDAVPLRQVLQQALRQVGLQRFVPLQWLKPKWR